MKILVLGFLLPQEQPAQLKTSLSAEQNLKATPLRVLTVSYTHLDVYKRQKFKPAKTEINIAVTAIINIIG